MLGLLSSKRVQLTIVIILTTLVYSNIFTNSFVFDDHRLIIGWPYHHSFKYIPDLFPKETPLNSVTGTYRPLRGIFFMVSYKLFGEKPWGYHLVSLLVHLSSTFLVYLITLEVLQSSKLKVRKSASTVTPSPGLIVNRKSLIINRLLPFLTALLFGLHPIHTEAITFITPSFDNIGSVFMLGAFYLYLKSTAKNSTYFVLSIIFAFIAAFTYETTIVLSLLLVLYEFLFGRLNWKRLAPFFSITFFYLFVRVVIVQIAGRGEYLGGSFYLTMLTMVKTVVKYITLLIFPSKLSLDQTVSAGIKAHLDAMTSIDKILGQSIFDPNVLLNILIILFLVVVAFKAFKKYPLITFGIGWFFVSLLPFLFLVPQGPIMQERYIYVASLGWCMVLSYLGYLSYLRYGGLILVILIVLAVGYGTRTYVRNFDWKDEATLWQHQARDFDDDVQANFLAGTFLESSEPDQAIHYYRRALNVDPNLPIVYLNLGKIYLAKGKREDAISQLRQALSLDRNLFDAAISLNKLGVKTSDIGFSDIVDWQEYKYLNSLSFYYPGDWKVSLRGRAINVADEDFKVEIVIDKWQGKMEEYLSLQTQSYGQLVNQGLAQVPNFEQAWVRVWSGSPSTSEESGPTSEVKSTKLQFFLFKGGKVITILVSDANSPKMKIFEKILETITIK